MSQDYLEQHLSYLEDLYARREYGKVMRESQDLLVLYPHNKRLCRLIRRVNWHLKNYEYKVALVFICLAMFVLAVGFVGIHSKFADDLRLKNLQINSLIDEVGVLQEENRNFTMDMETSRKDINLLSLLLKNIEASLKSFNKNIQKTKAEKTTEKKSVVDSLNKAKEVAYLSSPLTVSYPDDILDVLILGTHGTLTDTIIVLSVNPSSKTITLISVPRDFYVNGRKINEYYNKFGIGELKEITFDITGIKPDKYIVFNLQGFIDVVDILGGIDIYVPKDIYDSMYPGPNFTYEAYSISAGQHHFDGQEALKYARSRKSTTDWDRSKRQHDIIKAVRDKVESLGFFSDTRKLIQIYNTLQGAVVTDIGLTDGVSYLQNFENYKIEAGNTIDTGNFLYSTYNQRGQYILLPKGGGYEEIRKWIWELVKK